MTAHKTCNTVYTCGTKLLANEYCVFLQKQYAQLQLEQSLSETNTYFAASMLKNGVKGAISQFFMLYKLSILQILTELHYLMLAALKAVKLVFMHCKQESTKANARSVPNYQNTNACGYMATSIVASKQWR